MAPHDDLIGLFISDVVDDDFRRITHTDMRRDGEPRTFGASERRDQRSETISTVLNTFTSIVIWGTTALMVLSVFGVNIGPLLASAGIAGVALGFGAQTLVKDYISGLFLILEDQFGIGDVVEFGTVKGRVEAVALRTTKVRDEAGVLWYVRNGEILNVANHSQNTNWEK